MEKALIHFGVILKVTVWPGGRDGVPGGPDAKSVRAQSDAAGAAQLAGKAIWTTKNYNRARFRDESLLAFFSVKDDRKFRNFYVTLRSGMCDPGMTQRQRLRWILF